MKKLIFSIIGVVSLTAVTFAQSETSVYFRNTSANPVSIWVQVSTGTVPYEGDTGYIEDLVVQPEESINVNTGEYWHLYLIGTDLTTGESWDSDYNPGVHVSTGTLQLDWAGAFNGGGFTVSSYIDPDITNSTVYELSKKIVEGLTFTNGQWAPTQP
jgi:hypothetical protein